MPLLAKENAEAYPDWDIRIFGTKHLEARENRIGTRFPLDCLLRSIESSWSELKVSAEELLVYDKYDLCDCDLAERAGDLGGQLEKGKGRLVAHGPGAFMHK